MLVTPLGIATLARAEHPLNALLPILARRLPSAKMILLIAVQPANAPSPMLVTLFGMVTLVKEGHPVNAPRRMERTPLSMVTFVMLLPWNAY